MGENAIYIRTSTKDQDGRAQAEALERAAKARGWNGWTVYQDIGHSGAKASRPELDRLKSDVTRGHVTVVLVYGLDRLGRGLIDLLNLLQDLSAGGCAVVSLREGVDLSTPTGRLQVQLLGALAEFERELIRERVRSGMRAAQERGTRSGRAIGRPKAGVSPEQAGYLRRQGLSWAAIAKKLGCTRSAARRAVAGVSKSSGTPTEGVPTNNQ